MNTDLLSHKPFDSWFVNIYFVGGSVSMTEAKLLALLSISGAIHHPFISFCVAYGYCVFWLTQLFAFLLSLTVLQTHFSFKSAGFFCKILSPNAIHCISSTRHIHAFIVSFNDSIKLSA
jgi:hypothetical protein